MGLGLDPDLALQRLLPPHRLQLQLRLALRLPRTLAAAAAGAEWPP